MTLQKHPGRLDSNLSPTTSSTTPDSPSGESVYWPKTHTWRCFQLLTRNQSITTRGMLDEAWPWVSFALAKRRSRTFLAVVGLLFSPGDRQLLAVRTTDPGFPDPSQPVPALDARAETLPGVAADRPAGAGRGAAGAVEHGRAAGRSDAWQRGGLPGDFRGAMPGRRVGLCLGSRLFAFVGRPPGPASAPAGATGVPVGHTVVDLPARGPGAGGNLGRRRRDATLPAARVHPRHHPGQCWPGIGLQRHWHLSRRAERAVGDPARQHGVARAVHRRVQPVQEPSPQRRGATVARALQGQLRLPGGIHRSCIRSTQSLPAPPAHGRPQGPGHGVDIRR
ncbi:hypothetical protein PFLU4_57120 [Pseudomonas fluorescens]|nr:hypothetical protein PFLU4_57120 [Pseudomonas fluorescens]